MLLALVPRMVRVPGRKVSSVLDVLPDCRGVPYPLDWHTEDFPGVMLGLGEDAELLVQLRVELLGVPVPGAVLDVRVNAGADGPLVVVTVPVPRVRTAVVRNRGAVAADKAQGQQGNDGDKEHFHGLFLSWVSRLFVEGLARTFLTQPLRIL